MRPLIALKAFTYQGRTLVPGDTFQARRAVDVIVLRKRRQATFAPDRKTDEPPKQTPEPGTESHSIEEVLTDEERERIDEAHSDAGSPHVEPTRRRRRYQRRDLTPEP
jgi:hypothetical protein